MTEAVNGKTALAGYVQAFERVNGRTPTEAENREALALVDVCRGSGLDPFLVFYLANKKAQIEMRSVMDEATVRIKAASPMTEKALEAFAERLERARRRRSRATWVRRWPGLRSSCERRRRPTRSRPRRGTSAHSWSARCCANRSSRQPAGVGCRRASSTGSGCSASGFRRRPRCCCGSGSRRSSSARGARQAQRNREGDVKLSPHAKDQMVKRSITKEDIAAVLAAPTKQRPADYGRINYWGYGAGPRKKRIRVTVEPFSRVIVTVANADSRIKP
jgi:hypothetical protein